MMASAIPFDRLFDPELLAALSHLSISAQRVASGGRFGERISKDVGAGLEFRDYRAYTPGDDPRAIDWNIYRRLGRVFLRLYEEQQDLPLYLMPDISPSMFHGPAPRALAGLRCTLALAAIGLGHHDSTALLPFAEQVEVRVRSMSGAASTMAFAEHLAQLSQIDTRRTNLLAAIHRVGSMKLRRGLLVIISDFFDPQGLDALPDALRSIRHRLLFVQLIRQTDANPDLSGALRLRDCETGELAEVTITPQVLDRYRQAYVSFNRALADLAQRFHAGLLQLDVDADLVRQLHAFFASGHLRV